MAQHTTAKAEATRRALIDSARGLFGEHGYAATSLDQIVKGAGVTKGALYHHFRDKDHVFLAVVEEVKEEVANVVGAAFLAASRTQDPLQTLITGCLAFIDAHADPAVQRISVIDARAVFDPVTRRALDARFEVAAVRGALRSSMRSGAIDRQPLVTLSHIIAGGLFEACAVIAEASDQSAARAEAIELVTRLLDGLRVQVPDPTQVGV
jgi:AcrR family transcriptional regulator